MAKLEKVAQTAKKVILVKIDRMAEMARRTRMARVA